ncbi:glycosyltransferase [Planktomarina temperata]|nr:glycosyltransferase [Planktomarina temperata]
MNILIYNQASIIDSQAGSEVLTHKLAQEIQSLGHECMVVTRGNRTEVVCYEGVKYSILKKGKLNKFIHFKHEPSFSKTILENIKTNKVDLMIFCSFKNFPLTLIEKIKKEKVKTKFLVLDYNSICPSIKIFNNIEKKICKNFTDHSNCFECQMRGKFTNEEAIFWGRLTYKIISRLPISYFIYYKHRMIYNRRYLSMLDEFVFSNRTALETINPHMKIKKSTIAAFPTSRGISFIEPKIKKEITNFGFIGSSIPEKGLLYLLQAFPPSEKRCLNVYSKVLDDDYNQKVNSLIREKNIKFKGSFSYSEIKSVFETLDVLVIPSLWIENLPLVYVDALSFGRPVIVSHLSSLAPEVEKNGFGWIYKDQIQLAKIIENISGDDTEIMAKFSNIKKNFRPHSYHEYVRKYLLS